MKNCFKVAHKSHTISQSLELVSYFVDKRFTNTEFILYHVGSYVVKTTESEVIKLQLDQMSKYLQAKGIQLIISGPIPSTGLHTEAFSRLVAFDTWLKKWAAPECILYVSNFDLFWTKRHLFNRNSTLNETGASFLTDNIKFALESFGSDDSMIRQ